MQTFIQGVRRIGTIISAAADEGPDEMMCFHAGLHYLLTFPNKNVQNSTEIDVSLCEFFRERMSLYRHICELFQKGEGMDSVDPRGNTSL